MFSIRNVLTKEKKKNNNKIYKQMEKAIDWNLFAKVQTLVILYVEKKIEIAFS